MIPLYSQIEIAIEILIKESVSVSINICLWQDPMQLGIKLWVHLATQQGVGGVKWLDLKQYNYNMQN